MKLSEIVRGYHFVGDTLRDGRPVPPDGEWLEHTAELAMCKSGLHACRRPWEALAYAPGPILCEVDLGGAIEEDDKLVGRRRRIVRRVDLTEPLRTFARAEALRVSHLWECPDIVKRYLETGDNSIRAAAWEAARAAALEAAREAAWEAAVSEWSAAWEAEWETAGRRFDAVAAQAFGLEELS